MLKGLWDPTQPGWWAGDSVKWRLRAKSPARVAGWGVDGQELNTWDSLQPGSFPHGQACLTLTCVIAGSVDQWGQAQKTPAGSISMGERGKSSERALSELLPDTTSYTVPQALIHWNQQSKEVRERYNKGWSGLCLASALWQTCCPHQAERCCPL